MDHVGLVIHKCRSIIEMTQKNMMLRGELGTVCLNRFRSCFRDDYADAYGCKEFSVKVDMGGST